jgi:hypothetical protein
LWIFKSRLITALLTRRSCEENDKSLMNLLLKIHCCPMIFISGTSGKNKI